MKIEIKYKNKYPLAVFAEKHNLTMEVSQNAQDEFCAKFREAADFRVGRGETVSRAMAEYAKMIEKTLISFARGVVVPKLTSD